MPALPKYVIRCLLSSFLQEKPTLRKTARRSSWYSAGLQNQEAGRVLVRESIAQYKFFECWGVVEEKGKQGNGRRTLTRRI
jgi:hypothetical protein